MFFIGKKSITLHEISRLLESGEKIGLHKNALEEIKKSRSYLDKKISSSVESVYGVTTGFGSLYDKKISAEDLGTLQENLVMSHACGTGEEVPQEVARLILLLKIVSLSLGKSGVQLETVQRLVDFYNHGILPVIYEQGSLGASGDLAPLAHLSLPLIGKGEVYYKSKKISTQKLYAQLKWKPIRLKSKEGLALLNGTQFMAAYGVACTLNADKLWNWANIISALSLDTFDGRLEPFDPLAQKIRPHQGQIDTATEIRKILKGSELIKQYKKHIQDPYSFRCIPQVHGASKDIIDYAKQVFSVEINSVTDNPTVFPDEDRIISAGNFHGQILALTHDILAIALSELGSISERRTFQLISGARNLPPYLIQNAGINSGLMIPQYTAASIVSRNKQLCTPSSVDSIPSSNGQEDHVSMGANAAVKGYKVMKNTYTILAIELLTAAQALDFRRPKKTSPFLEKIFSAYRKKVKFIHNDRVLRDDITASEKFLEEHLF